MLSSCFGGLGHNSERQSRYPNLKCQNPERSKSLKPKIPKDKIPKMKFGKNNFKSS